MVGRHAGHWDDLNASEQLAFLSLVSTALSEGVPGFRPGLIDGHFALLLAPKDPERSGFLTTGGDDPLLPHLVEHIDKANAVDLAVAFALESGVGRIFTRLEDLLSRGGELRLVVRDYLDVTEPVALRRLRDLDNEELPGRLDARVFETDFVALSIRSADSCL